MEEEEARVVAILLTSAVQVKVVDTRRHMVTKRHPDSCEVASSVTSFTRIHIVSAGRPTYSLQVTPGFCTPCGAARGAAVFLYG